MNLQSRACLDLTISTYFYENSSLPLPSKVLLTEMFFPSFLYNSMTQQTGPPTTSLPGPALACALPSMNFTSSVYFCVCFAIEPELPNHCGALGDL